MKKILLLLLLFCNSISLNAFEWALYGVDGREFNSGISVSYSTKDDKSGYIDNTGKLVIPYIFDSAGKFHGNYAEVTIDKKQGIIDRSGRYLVQPGDYEIYYFEEMPGAFRMKDNATEKSAFFDGNRFVTGFEFDYINFYGNYPFLSLTISGQNRVEHTYNVTTQQFFEKCFPQAQGNYYTLITGGKSYVFDLTGEPVKTENFLESSKRIEVYKDEVTGKYGLRDAYSHRVVEPARYKLPRNVVTPLWLADVIILNDSISPERSEVNVAFDKFGKKILAANPDFTLYINQDFIKHHSQDYNNHTGASYYDFNGNEITELRNCSVYPISKGFYRDSENDRVYDRNNRTFLTDVEIPAISDGMMHYRDKSNQKYYYINIATGKKIGPYDVANQYNEGVAVVSKNGKKLIINKDGKEYTFPNNIEIWGYRVNEGVIFGRDDENSVYGFIYNPFGHQGWAYNQKSGQVSDYGYRHLVEAADKSYSDKKYAKAMNEYYQLMMLRPEESSNFDNYSLCLYVLGYYDEALTAVDVALQHWPGDEYAVNLKNKIEAAIQERDRAKEEEYVEEEESYSVWDALGNFANMLSNLGGGYASGGGYSSYYGGGYSSSATRNTGGGNYQAQYDNWARRAESNYRSLTNLGYSTTSKSGHKQGGAGGKLSSGTYVGMKRNLREAQQNMARIRRKAMQAGVKIVQSQWETATVGY